MKRKKQAQKKLSMRSLITKDSIPVPEFLKKNLKESDKTLIVGPGLIHRDPTSVFIGREIGTKNLIIMDTQRKYHPFKRLYGGIARHKKDWEITKKRISFSKKGNPKWIQADAREMALKSNSIDKIVDHYSFRQILVREAHPKLFKEYIRVLKPGGKAFLFDMINLIEPSYLTARKGRQFGGALREVNKLKREFEDLKKKFEKIDKDVKIEVMPVSDWFPDYGTEYKGPMDSRNLDDLKYLERGPGYIDKETDYVFIIKKPKKVSKKR